MRHTIHRLKTVTDVYPDLAIDSKRGCLRLNDRGYRAGDVAHFREWDPTAVTVDPDTQTESPGAYTGRECWRTITHVQPGGRFGLDPQYVMLSLRDVDDQSIL